MKKTILLLASISILCLTSITTLAQTKESKIKVIEESNFNENIKSGLVLVDFYADWCGPCRMLQPVLEEVATEYEGKLVVTKVNTDKNKTLSSKFQVRGIPCMILFKDGKEVKRIVGYQDKTKLQEELSSFVK